MHYFRYFNFNSFLPARLAYEVGSAGSREVGSKLESAAEKAKKAAESDKAAPGSPDELFQKVVDVASAQIGRAETELDEKEAKEERKILMKEIRDFKLTPDVLADSRALAAFHQRLHDLSPYVSVRQYENAQGLLTKAYQSFVFEHSLVTADTKRLSLRQQANMIHQSNTYLSDVLWGNTVKNEDFRAMTSDLQSCSNIINLVNSDLNFDDIKTLEACDDAIYAIREASFSPVNYIGNGEHWLAEHPKAKKKTKEGVLAIVEAAKKLDARSRDIMNRLEEHKKVLGSSELVQGLVAQEQERFGEKIDKEKGEPSAPAETGPRVATFDSGAAKKFFDSYIQTRDIADTTPNTDTMSYNRIYDTILQRLDLDPFTSIDDEFMKNKEWRKVAYEVFREELTKIKEKELAEVYTKFKLDGANQGEFGRLAQEWELNYDQQMTLVEASKGNPSGLNEDRMFEFVNTYEKKST